MCSTLNKFHIYNAKIFYCLQTGFFNLFAFEKRINYNRDYIILRPEKNLGRRRKEKITSHTKSQFEGMDPCLTSIEVDSVGTSLTVGTLEVEWLAFRGTALEMIEEAVGFLSLLGGDPWGDNSHHYGDDHDVKELGE